MKPQDIDRIECAIRHIQTAVDVDPWAVDIAVEAMEKEISALQAQDSPKPKAESVQNVQNEDLILRKAAIEAECEVCQIAPKKERGHNCTYYVHGCKEIECLRVLPSAQPEIEERTEEFAQNVPIEDLISRKAAIDALDCINGTEEVLRSLPSAQPESEERTAESAQNVPIEDLISRNAAIDALRNINAIVSPISDDVFLIDKAEAMTELMMLPSAQPEITHCKDCKHFGVDRYKKLTWCSRINYGYGYQADDFCSKAERRTDEGD